MPKNTRQTIKQKFKSLFDHFDWIEYHLADIQRFYREGMEQHEDADYTEYINALECALQASKELRAGIEEHIYQKV